MALNDRWLGVCYFALQTLQALGKIYRQNNSTKPLLAEVLNTKNINMEFSELKNKKKVSAFVKEPFNARIVFKVEEQINAITEEDIYKMSAKHKGLTLEFWVENQEDVDFWKLE